jgi:hypothetical protein
MELLVKPEILTSYIYGRTFGNAESRLFLFAAQCFNTINAESYPVGQSCVNTWPDTKITLITDGIQFGTARVNCTVHNVAAMAAGSPCGT